MQNKQHFDIAYCKQADFLSSIMADATMPVAKRAAPPPTQATSAPTKRPRHESDDPGVHVIFVGISQHKDIGEEGYDCRIPCDPAVGSFEAGDVLGGLTPERLQQLEDSLGPGLSATSALE